MENNSLVRVMRYTNQPDVLEHLFEFMSSQGWGLYDISVMPGSENIEAVFIWHEAVVCPSPEYQQ